MKFPWQGLTEEQIEELKTSLIDSFKAHEAALEEARETDRTEMKARLELLETAFIEQLQASVQGLVAHLEERWDDVERFAQRAEAAAGRAKMYIDGKQSGGPNRPKKGQEAPQEAPEEPEEAGGGLYLPKRGLSAKAELHRLHNIR